VDGSGVGVGGRGVGVGGTGVGVGGTGVGVGGTGVGVGGTGVGVGGKGVSVGRTGVGVAVSSLSWPDVSCPPLLMGEGELSPRGGWATVEVCSLMTGLFAPKSYPERLARGRSEGRGAPCVSEPA